MIQNGKLHDQIMEIGFSRHEGVFADGQLANNKLEADFDRLSQYPAILHAVVQRMADLAQPYQPQFVGGIPNGATGLADAVANELSCRQGTTVRSVHFKKIEVPEKRIIYATDVDKSKVDNLDRGVLIEDVFNRGSTTERALCIEGLSPKILAIIAGFIRGSRTERRPLGKPVHGVVERPIAAMLPLDDDRWRFVSMK